MVVDEQDLIEGNFPMQVIYQREDQVRIGEIVIRIEESLRTEEMAKTADSS